MLKKTLELYLRRLDWEMTQQLYGSHSTETEDEKAATERLESSFRIWNRIKDALNVLYTAFFPPSSFRQNSFPFSFSHKQTSGRKLRTYMTRHLWESNSNRLVFLKYLGSVTV